MSIEDALARAISNEGIFIPFLVGSFIVIGTTISTIGKTIKSVARERTRREIAAYIAEGTMTPEQGERLMKAGDRSSSC